MKKFLITLGILTAFIAAPQATQAAGISASGGTSKAVGQTFTVTITASGTTFDSLQGTLNVSGPVSVVSVAPGSATWLPGKEPANGKQFVGLVGATSSMTVAKVTLKGTKEGSGSVSVSGVKLAFKGAVVGSDGGSTNFTITRALVTPGGPKVTSSTHPDQNQAYEATSVKLDWNKDNGVTGFSYTWDESATTTPPTKVTSSETTITYDNVAIGTHYFHIRAQNGDGWGGTTHYKVTIKEPDAKVDTAAGKTTIDTVATDATFATKIDDGTVTGIVLRGKGPVGFTINLTFMPALTLPEGKTLTAPVTEVGTWEYLIDFPIHAGFYSVTAQGQKEKTLTEASAPLRFETTLAKGGGIHVITEADAQKPIAAKPSSQKNSAWYKSKPMIFGAAGLAVLLLITTIALLQRQKRGRFH